jgi:predicted acetylornithine/succinylornithine family transaminase
MNTDLNTQEIINLDAAYVLGTYPRAPIVFESGQGMWLFDSKGRRYLDFTSGIAVNALGHAAPEIVQAVETQIHKLMHVSNLYYTRPQAELARDLCQKSFAERVFFCNSGAEAVEAAIKFARKSGRQAGGEQKTRLVAFSGGFHGRTMGALALTAREKYQAPFRPLMPNVDIVPFNDLQAAKQVIGPQTCGVIVEPIQGEGGLQVADEKFLAGLRELCDRHNARLIFDEIQCGLGRTGKLWAYEHSGVIPDMMTLAKALGGGLPMGAVLLNGHCAEVIAPGDHGSTFAAGPVAASSAQVVLDRVSSAAMLAHVNQVAGYLAERLAALQSPHIQEIRGRGLMIGIRLDRDVQPLLEAGYQQGILLLNAGPDVLRLLPALILTKEHVDLLVEFLTGARL